jgi:His Kinase A (phosphoacceptor) domain.
MQQELGSARQIQAQVYDTMHNLLHQFKSPLTALRTFGKLLARRLVPEDKNRNVAFSIVRESERLQELLGQFDRTVDTGEAHLKLPSDFRKSQVQCGINPAFSSVAVTCCQFAGILFCGRSLKTAVNFRRGDRI